MNKPCVLCDSIIEDKPVVHSTGLHFCHDCYDQVAEYYNTSFVAGISGFLSAVVELREVLEKDISL